jgi:hypothetical protein
MYSYCKSQKDNFVICLLKQGDDTGGRRNWYCTGVANDLDDDNIYDNAIMLTVMLITVYGGSCQLCYSNDNDLVVHEDNYTGPVVCHVWSSISHHHDTASPNQCR